MGSNFRVGPWLVEPSLNSISGKGAKHHLEPKVMDVLVYLARHPGESLSKEKLLQEVWPGTFVTDDALTRCIFELRRVFEDEAKEPCIIQTIPKRGYRLIAPVAPVKEAEEPQRAGSGQIRAAKIRKSGIALLALFAVTLIFVLLGTFHVVDSRNWLTRKDIPQIHSLAVLPLRNLSSDPDQEYFSDGVTDTLITTLAQINSLKVISHTSTMQYRDTKKSLPEIARELNVDGIIEGTVQRSGKNVRINVQLIHGPSDKHIWANSYDRDIGDIFALERDVTEEVARQVQARLVTQGQPSLAAPRQVKPRALDAYLEGNYHLRRVAHDSIDEELNKAAEYFQQAIDADPKFAPAYVGLSRAIGSHMRNSVEDATASRRAAEKAVELDPTSSAARVALGDFKLFYSLDWAGAEEQYRRAVALNSSSPEAHDGLSHFLYAMGRINEGWSESQLAQELDPNQDHLSVGLIFRRDYDRAIEVLLRWVEHHPDDGDAYGNLSIAYTLKGMRRESLEALVRSVSLSGYPNLAVRIQHVFSTSGYEPAERAFARELEHLAATKEVFLPASTAGVYASIGDKERAFYWLEQAYRYREIVGRESGLVYIKVDPALDPLRSDPRFQDLLRRVGLPP